MNVDVIVPIYNEGKYLNETLRSLLETGLFTNVICVNDGSTDNSLDIIKSFGNRVICVTYKKNQGKGNALAEGILKSSSEIVCFIDADLKGLNKKNLSLMIEPLRSGSHEVVIGCIVDLLHKYSPKMSWAIAGERAYFRKDVLPLTEKIRRKRFGVEIFLNDAFSNKKIKKIRLDGVRQILKIKKYDKLTSVKETLREGYELGREVFVVRLPKLKNSISIMASFLVFFWR